MLFSAVIFAISDDLTRSWQCYANSCTAFFILKQLRNQLIEKNIWIYIYIYSYYHMNIDVYKNIIEAFFLVPSI